MNLKSEADVALSLAPADEPSGKRKKARIVLRTLKFEELQDILLKKERVPIGTWMEIQNHRVAFEILRSYMGAYPHNLKAWYNISSETFRDLHLTGLLDSHYKSSPQRFIETFMPCDEWAQLCPWMFVNGCPKNYWNDRANLQRALDTLRKHVGADYDNTRWYTVTIQTFEELKLNGVLVGRFGGSPQLFLQTLMPTDEWDKLLPWMFSTVPSCYWREEKHHRKALDIVRKHVGAESDSKQWYRVTKNMLDSLGLCGLLNLHYDSSPQKFLAALMPKEEWDELWPWMFIMVPNGFWQDTANHLRAVEVVRRHIGADSDLEAWYKLTLHDFKTLGLKTMLINYYSASIHSFIESMAPTEYERLLPWKFYACPRGFWENNSNHHWALNELRKYLKADIDIRNWYGATTDALRSFGLAGMLSLKYNFSVKTFLECNMPSEEWTQLDITKFNTTSAQELWAISEVTNRQDFLLLGADALNRRQVSFGQSHYRWDLVIYHVPSERVGVLELDGEQHFHYDDWAVVHVRDAAKLDCMTRHTPPCCSNVDFIARVSYRQRYRGRSAIEDLLDMIAHDKSHFLCLPEDMDMYTKDGLPRYIGIGPSSSTRCGAPTNATPHLL